MPKSLLVVGVKIPRVLVRPAAAMGMLLAAGLLWADAALAQSFVVPDDTSPSYGGYALVAGVDIRVTGDAQVSGNVYANEDVEISPGAGIIGSATAGGAVAGAAGVAGPVSDGQPPIALPALPSTAWAEDMAKATFPGDTEFQDLRLNGILYIDGDAIFRGSLNGQGTIYASEDIRLEEAPAAVLQPGAEVSLIALGDIWIDRDREFRGLLNAGEDIKIKSGASVEGIAIAAGVVDLDPGVTVTYLAVDE